MRGGGARAALVGVGIPDNAPPRVGAGAAWGRPRRRDPWGTSHSILVLWRNLALGDLHPKPPLP
jgi:hypothetical protein